MEMTLQRHQEWNQTFWNCNPALLDPKFWVYFSMNSMLCWFWCCVKACPGSCSKHPGDPWCFEFHWWKPARCVDIKANTFPKRNALWNSLAAATSSSLPWGFNCYVNQEPDQIPEAMYWVWIPGISTDMGLMFAGLWSGSWRGECHCSVPAGAEVF